MGSLLKKLSKKFVGIFEMHYSVKLNKHSVLQIQEAITYISKVLFAPDTAKAWSDYLEKKIAGLDTMPERFPLVDKEPWHSNGIRKMPVKNFIVYYYVDNDLKEVWITAVVYAKQNQLNALSEIPL